MKPESILLLKLGGSILTDKGRDCAIQEDTIKGIAANIAERWPLPLVLVHGAGSCGHPEAHRYRIQEGISKENCEGIPVTHEAVCRLNDAVVQALRRNRVPAVGIHPLHGFISRDGRIDKPDIRNIRAMIENGLLPVLHGDVVMDVSRGACIISGDQLIVMLGRELPAGRIGVATDVAGVLCNGQVIREITPKTKDLGFLGESLHTDVTGGMKGKIAELLALAREGRSSEIFHLSKIPEFLDGRSTGGTGIAGGQV